MAQESPPSTDKALVQRVASYVQEYMSQYDGSHDYNHILRVLGLAQSIYAQSPTSGYDIHIITLAALLHDVGDKKYLLPGQDAGSLVKTVLLSFGVSEATAERVQTVVTHVSYSSEIKNPQLVLDVMIRFPELAVVQDADRLDAIGAVGIGRTFTFGGAMDGKARALSADEASASRHVGRGMGETIQHFEDKLLKLESMMKTEPGRKMARERTERLRTFIQWWGNETDVTRGASLLLS